MEERTVKNVPIYDILSGGVPIRSSMSEEQQSGVDAESLFDIVDENIQAIVEELDGVPLMEETYIDYDGAVEAIEESRDALGSARGTDLSAEQETTLEGLATAVGAVDLLLDVTADGDELLDEFGEAIEVLAVAVENPNRAQEVLELVEDIDAAVDAVEGGLWAARYELEEIDDVLAELSHFDIDAANDVIDHLLQKVEHSNWAVTGTRLYFQGTTHFVTLASQVRDIDSVEADVVEDTADLITAADGTLKRLQEISDEELDFVAETRAEVREIDDMLADLEDSLYALEYGNEERADEKFQSFLEKAE